LTNIIHPTAIISALSDIETSFRGSTCSIGQMSVVESFVKIKFAGGSGDVVIGDDCNLNSGTVIYSGHGVRIGNGVLIAANCTLAASNHAYLDRDRRIRDQGLLPSKGGITIEDDVWIASNCTLLDGTQIGKGAVIGAGSLVRGKIEPFSVVAGNPLRVVGFRNSLSKPINDLLGDQQ
jgi:virginiamycin A acetyltransferase